MLENFVSKSLPVIENFPPIAKGCVLMEANINQEDQSIVLIFNHSMGDIGFKIESPKADDPDNIATMKRIKMQQIAKLCKGKDENLQALIGQLFTLETKTQIKTSQKGVSYVQHSLYKFSLEGDIPF